MKFTKPLTIFGLVSLSCGWAGVAVDRLLGTPEGTQGPGMLIWLTAPLATAAILRWRYGGWSDAGLSPKLPRSAKWYAAALGIPLLIGSGAVGLASLTGHVAVRWDWQTYLTLIASTIGFNLIKNVFEEFSWRGFLASKLIGARHSDLTIYLVTGLIWGLWHLPYYLFLLDGTLISTTLDVPRPLFALLAMLVLMGWTVVQVELFRLSGSVWVPLLLHSIHNTVIDPIGALGYATMPTPLGLIFSPIVGLGTTGIWLGIGLALRRYRLGRGSDLSERAPRRTRRPAPHH